MTVKEMLEKIDKEVMKLEINFDNHLAHHKRVIFPFIVAIIVLLVSLHFRG